MGEATSEQKKAYTNVLLGIIRLSMLVFPENLKPAEADTLIRLILYTSNIIENFINVFIIIKEDLFGALCTTIHI